MCRECVRNYAANNTPWQCNSCKAWKHEDAFARMYARPQCTFYRVCQTCEAQKRCYKCGTAKPESAFGAAAWKGRHADRRVCRDCAMKVKGAWRCAVCTERKARNDFSAWSRQRAAPQDGTQRLCPQRGQARSSAARKEQPCAAQGTACPGGCTGLQLPRAAVAAKCRAESHTAPGCDADESSRRKETASHRSCAGRDR